jgi:biotin-[acetyl-CoA-carboxylase] ligase BirA-like protein
MPWETYDGIDHRELARLTGARSVVVKSSVHSTLDVAHVMAQGGAPSGTLILAEEQTGGRGRQGRAWHSQKGAGIWMTLLLRPRIAPAGGALALRSGLAIVDTLAKLAPDSEPRLKWPNDVLIRGAKVAGVLCEARWTGDMLTWIAIGIGINVGGPVPAALQGTAIALADVAPKLTRRAILEELVPRLLEFEAADTFLTDAERARFLRFAWAAEGQTIAGLSADGALMLRKADGTIERRADAS